MAHNPTDIPAGLKTLVEGRDSPFKVDPREAQLQPHESLPIKVCLSATPSSLLTVKQAGT